jgi:hypothetical protein
MTTKRPIPTTPALDRRRGRSGHDTTDPARGERDHERADAQWLYAWSYEALRPTGELLAARVTTPAVLRPGTIGRVSSRTRRRQTSPDGWAPAPRAARSEPRGAPLASGQGSPSRVNGTPSPVSLLDLDPDLGRGIEPRH